MESIKFDISANVNTGGTARIVSFAKTCENLKLYVHISTAYLCRQGEGKIMEESFGKGHFVRSNADIFDASHKHIPDLDIEADLRLASELEQSSKENEKGQISRKLGMSVRKWKV
ncbi:hypothetical protein POM88_015462 [Heracleum sosnowskyi]|uniref:Fatty acyl-CoA reductase n=1 Tax=Heracleum sosnowskyi TaxID=360622 RepID=A0AAD8ILQ7_9APIA|nr:hypothetical protein POM88_015462 [Heracleum sosnowskyi]